MAIAPAVSCTFNFYHPSPGPALWLLIFEFNKTSRTFSVCSFCLLKQFEVHHKPFQSKGPIHQTFIWCPGAFHEVMFYQYAKFSLINFLKNHTAGMIRTNVNHKGIILYEWKLMCVPSRETVYQKSGPSQLSSFLGFFSISFFLRTFITKLRFAI